MREVIIMAVGIMCLIRRESHSAAEKSTIRTATVSPLAGSLIGARALTHLPRTSVRFSVTSGLPDSKAVETYPPASP